MNKVLVGGLYGVAMGDFVSGESMFMKEDNASKLALYSLVLKLQSVGIAFLDTQMVTPVVEQFGGKYVPRSEFIEMIKRLDWNSSRSKIFQK
jgi:leucyl/phenylalanyl-tRNA--protein transferase